jgi:hypothetical protein
VAAIVSGKYANIRGMFSPSATTPTAGQWKTAQQAVQDGNETSPTYSLFDMVSSPFTCWYFNVLVDQYQYTGIVGWFRAPEIPHEGGHLQPTFQPRFYCVLLCFIVFYCVLLCFIVFGVLCLLF